MEAQLTARGNGPATHTQVEVNCGERGRALSFVWNTYLTAHERTVAGLKKDLRRLTVSNEEVRGLEG